MHASAASPESCHENEGARDPFDNGEGCTVRGGIPHKKVDHHTPSSGVDRHVQPSIPIQPTVYSLPIGQSSEDLCPVVQTGDSPPAYSDGGDD
jgi:hypothetical protein